MSATKVAEPLLAWTRTCKVATTNPVKGAITGSIPPWIEGSLIRNGPGMKELAGVKYNHLFDGSALLHKFTVQNGGATYQNRFIESHGYKTNMAANRMVIGDFGTLAVPDPCMSIFQRFQMKYKSLGKLDATKIADNTNVNIAAYGDELYAMTETQNLIQFSKHDLKTLSKVNLMDKASVFHATAHPHGEDGAVYNLGSAYPKGKPHYIIVKFAPDQKDQQGKITKRSIDQGQIVTQIPARWKYFPSYYHSFGMTKNHFIIMESSLCYDMKKLILLNKLMSKPNFNAFTWFGNEKSYIRVVDRKTGHELPAKYEIEPFMGFHHINAFEEDGKLNVDIAAYKSDVVQDLLMKNLVSYSLGERPAPVAHPATGKVNVKEERLANVSMEFPRINYKLNGQKYNYFYGTKWESSEENKKNKYPVLSQQIVKISTSNGNVLNHTETGKEVSEPVFVSDPKGTAEDDGVLLVSLLDVPDPTKVELLVLDAKNLKEQGRAIFRAESSVPTTFHGSFFR